MHSRLEYDVLAAVSAKAPGQGQVRANLKTWGAPLEAVPAPKDLQDAETVLVQGVKLARTDASVARGLPVFIWKVDHERLLRESMSQGEKHAVGFFLALTAERANDAALAKTAEG